VSVLLDTHIWIWWLTSGAPLSDRERDGLDALAAAGEVWLSAVSLWEAQMLHQKGRLTLPVPFEEWLPQAAGDRVVRVAPLDVDVVLALDRLPASFHGDPADRLIVATGRARRLPLATKDRGIRRSRAVKLWRP
jgi:PIN domain nuclease of toxin-antitoxin system